MNLSAENKTFLEHLEDLRQVLFRIIAVVVILFPVSFYFADRLIVLLVKYSCPPDFALRYFSPMEPLFVKIKIALLTALFAGLPYVAFVVWRFVVPALYPEEKRVIKRLTICSWLLFFAGISFCFFFVIPAMMRFSLSMQTDELQAAIGLSNYIGLIGMLLLGFGIMFQLPIVIFFLASSGMIELETLKKLRPIALIVILVLSALLTPPDIFSQLMMAVPTYLLFEISLFVSSITIRKKKNSEPDDVFFSDVSEEPEEDFFPQDQDYDDYTMQHYRGSNNKKRKLRYIPR